MKTPPLADIQRRFFGLVRRRLDVDYRLAPLPVEGEVSAQSLHDLVKPNERLTAEERLELYARQYWFRLIDSFREDFPGVAALLGPDLFHALTLDYLDAHPSRAYTLRRLGQFFPGFLADPATRIPEPLRGVASDMARLEWAKMEVFDAAEVPALTPEDALGADILVTPIGLQPHIRLLELAHPVDAWLVNLHREEWRAEASNAVGADGPRAASGPAAKLSPPRRRVTRVAVHHQGETAFFKRMPLEAFRLLAAFREGRTLGEALDMLMAASVHPPAWWQARIGTWFAEWAALRWLTPGAAAASKTDL